MYRHRGETKIRISKSLEAVYYHPMRSCAPSASGTKFKMDDKVAGELSDSNRQLLWREFGVHLPYVKCSLFSFSLGEIKVFQFFFYRMRCEGSNIVIHGSGSNPASRQRAMAIQAVLIQLTLSIFEDYLELSYAFTFSLVTKELAFDCSVQLISSYSVLIL